MKLPVLLVLAGVGLGCQAPLGNGDNPIPVDSEFLFQLREAHNPDGTAGPPKPMLFLVTSEQLECCNYEILNRVETQGEMLRVDLLGMNLPGGLCLTAFGPAQACIPLPSPAAFDRLVFRYHGQADNYTVAIDENSIRVSGRGSELIHVQDTLVWRFPRQSLVYTCGTLTEDSCLCQQFRDTLLARLDLEPVEVPENGFWPYPKQTIGYYYNMTPLVYRYSSESEFRRAGEILEAFTRATLTGRQGVGLALNNWRNEHRASWMVRDP